MYDFVEEILLEKISVYFLSSSPRQITSNTCIYAKRHLCKKTPDIYRPYYSMIGFS